jgi:hypothetical protein
MKTDPRTGEMGLFPYGIDPGWDYNPAKTWPAMKGEA